MSNLKQGFGDHSMWGLSPSYDLLSRIDVRVQKPSCNGNNQNEINILLVKPSDARHLIHTLSRRNRHRHTSAASIHHPKINIFILESETEVLARHFLQLQVFLDDTIPIRHRAALYLELYNALICKKTEDHVRKVSTLLGDWVCTSTDKNNCDEDEDEGEEEDGGKENNERKNENEDEPSCSYLKNLVDLSWLKQKEMDSLYSTFCSWLGASPYIGKTNEYEDASVLRDYRLRNFYGDRYDCRANVLELDYYTRVKKAAGIIHADQWKEFRMRGVAFEFGSSDSDSKYVCTNRTMLTSIKGTLKTEKGDTDSGDRQCDRNRNHHRSWGASTCTDVKGYWLDILNGPFVSHGVEIADRRNGHGHGIGHGHGLDSTYTASTGATVTPNPDTNTNGNGSGSNEEIQQQEACEQEDLFSRGLFEVVNKGTGAAQQRHHTVEVAMYNIISFLWELQTGKRYKMQTEHDIFSGLGLETKVISSRETLSNSDANKTTCTTNACNQKEIEPTHSDHSSYERNNLNENIKNAMDGITIIPLIGDIKTLSWNKKYKRRFDHVFLSQHSAHWIGCDELRCIMRSNDNDKQIYIPSHANVQNEHGSSVDVEVETGKFIFQLTEKDQLALLKKVRDIAKGNYFVEETVEGDKDLGLNAIQFNFVP